METFLEAYNKHILSSLEYIAKIVRKHRSVSISTAIALATVSYVYYKLTTPPKHMRHIPKGDSIKLLRAIASGWTATEIAKKIQIPAAMQAEHGLYTMVDHEGWAVHIQDPNAAKKFLLKIDLFPKEEVKQLRPGTVIGNFFLEPNITTVIGDQWRAHRKIANPAFHRSMPIHLFAELSHKLMRVMDKIDPTVDFIDLTTRFTLDALGLAGFDFNFNAIEDPESEWVIKYHSFSKHMFNPLYILFPILERKFLWLLPHRKKVHQDLDDFRNMLDRVIVNKRRILQEEQNAFSDKKESEKDLLTLMIESENKGEGSLSNDELKGNLSVFFLAGHDTTALSLAYAVYYMAVNPEVQRKAREEAISIFGDGPEDVFPTLDELRSLKYINCIIKETLRMNNPAPTIMPRRATEDTDLNGVFLQKGTRLVLDIHGIHHNPRFWKDPETFNPDRYLEGNEYDNLSSTLSWLAFSNGARQCIGMNFSLAEQRILLPLLLRKYEWTLPEDSIHKNGLKASAIGLSVVKDLKITFKRRH